MAVYALVGNPNAGKTSLFNLLTGTRQHVGNWPGVTVEKKVGVAKYDESIQIVDLPGIYSISPFSIEEKVASQFLMEEDIDKLINIVDASNLERNLYFTLQLLELGKPMVMSLNMIDVAKTYGIQIDVKLLEERLGIPVVPMMARKGKGYDELIQAFDQAEDPPNFQLDYGAEIEWGIHTIEQLIHDLPQFRYHNLRWIALQLLEENSVVEGYIEDKKVWDHILAIRENLAAKLNTSVAQVIREKRFLWINQMLQDVMTIDENKQITWTERIDAVVTHKYLGIPLFFLFMFLTFQATFSWIGTPLQDLLDGFINGPFSHTVKQLLISIHAEEWLIRFIVDGIIAGVGGVLVFVPQIFVLFFIISFLEDSGYMARAAFVMDKAMAKIGLNGKAFIPMIIGFGCNVPGIMAARTMEQEKERLITILLSPFMSCSARLAVYALFTSIFFRQYQSIVVFSLYVLGIILAILLGLIFKRFLLKQEESLFVLELPPYRVPMVRSLLLNTWDKGKNFIKKAGTVIFSMAVVLWLLANFSFQGMVENMSDSFLALFGKVLAPIFAPLGFGTWQSAVALISGFMAKEIVVSTMSIVYGTGGTISDLSGVIQSIFTPVTAYAFMVFVLLYTPCMATLVVMKKETGSWKWPLFSIGYSFTIAWMLAFIVNQIGHLLI
ncbi:MULTISPECIES: ferrous iron transport protein B [Tepidibacillus]|uniref:Ferrous iron transport protein B n=1 Tax=Tepidibacillus fermentans TaxID=1281767 RepID=A0A4V2USR8_9BACI|nr:ferrous iron transport protein B [Tepidibacillus fermentans]TCS82472.1 ferrous iron transport protein B [Tepidibacillus fermentans]